MSCWGEEDRVGLTQGEDVNREGKLPYLAIDGADIHHNTSTALFIAHY